MRTIVAPLVTAGLMLLTMPAVVSAQPVEVTEERTDNDVSFTYDESSGEIGTQTSRREFSRDDQVSFEVAIVEADDAGPGLIGRLKLRLDGDQHTIYDGWFALKVSSDGSVYYQRFRPAEIHLRPRPGQRTAAITFRFDLPSGDYRAIGTFDGE